MNKHSHQCGLTATGGIPGCGHIWSHEEQVKWELKDHYCPKCGRGPFTMKVEDIQTGLHDLSRSQS